MQLSQLSGRGVGGVIDESNLLDVIMKGLKRKVGKIQFRQIKMKYQLAVGEETCVGKRDSRRSNDEDTNIVNRWLGAAGHDWWELLFWHNNEEISEKRWLQGNSPIQTNQNGSLLVVFGKKFFWKCNRKKSNDGPLGIQMYQIHTEGSDKNIAGEERSDLNFISLNTDTITGDWSPFAVIWKDIPFAACDEREAMRGKFIMHGFGHNRQATPSDPGVERWTKTWGLENESVQTRLSEEK